MRLDSKRVRFFPPFLQLGIYRVPVRFSGKGSTLQLQETAMVVEGNLLKVGLLGFENYFRAALSEWSIFSVPYSRIESVKTIRFPVLRIVGLILLLIGGFFGAFFIINAARFGNIPYELLAIGLPFALFGALGFFYVQPRLKLKIRRADGKATHLFFQIRPRRLREEFLEKLREYRLASARFAAGELPGDLAEHLHSTDLLLQRIRRRDRGIRFGLYLSIVAGIISVGIGSATRGLPRDPLAGAYSSCTSLGDALALIGDIPNGRIEGFVQFARVLEWIVAPLVFLIFLFPPAKSMRVILVGYAVLRLFETLYGIYGLLSLPAVRGDQFAVSGIILLAFCLLYLWWLRRLTSGVESKGGDA